MVKALFITTIAGTHRSFLLPYAYHFRKKGWRVDGAAAGISRVPECCQAYDNVYEMKWSRNPLAILPFYSCSRRIRSLVEAESYDLVHVHTPVAAFVSRFALRRRRLCRNPIVIYTSHGFHFHPKGNPLANLVFLKIEQRAGCWTDHLIVINRHDEATALRFGIVPREKITYMPGIGINRANYNPDRVGLDGIAKIRFEIGLSEREPLFVVVADFMPGKRHEDVIVAFQGLQKNSHLAFAGAGNKSSTLARLVRNLGLESRVHFLGLRSDIPELMSSAVATILPSIREGLSRSVMESLCMGVPVIGTDIRGIQELLKDGGGLLVPVKSPEALRKAMEWILSHPEEAKAMGRKGRETTAKYDLNNVLRLHDELYAEVLSEKEIAIYPPA